MLARVTEIIRPATRRRGGGVSGGTTATSSDAAILPSAAAGLPVTEPGAGPSPATVPETAVMDASVPLPNPGAPAEEGGLRRARAVLKGKPSAVIKRFVTENNIDMLVIPVTAQPILRRMDKESKRGAPRGHSDGDFFWVFFATCSQLTVLYCAAIHPAAPELTAMPIPPRCHHTACPVHVGTQGLTPQ